MTTEHSTYTYESGAQETVTLLRGRLTPTGHALLKIAYSDGGKSDCYVNLAWLRDRADQLADTPRPLPPDAITDEMVERAREVLAREHWVQSFDPEAADMFDREDHADATRVIIATLTAALTEPPKRPEGAEGIEALVEESLSGDALSDAQVRALADFLAERGVRVTGGN